MVERSRMELRPRGAAAMLTTAARVCAASWFVLLTITFFIAAYDSAVERYSFDLTSKEGKTVVHFSLGNDEPMSFTLEDLLDPSKLVGSSDRGEPGGMQGSNFTTEGNHGSESLVISDGYSNPSGDYGTEGGALGFAEENAETFEDQVQGGEDDVLKPLPSLLMVRFGNVTTDHVEAAEDLMPVSAVRSTRRRFEEKNLVQPSHPAIGILLAVLVVLVLILVMIFYFTAVVLGMFCHSVASAYMGTTARMWNAIATGFRSPMVHMMRLLFLKSIMRAIGELVVMEVVLGGSRESESLVGRLYTMPFTFLAPFRDDEIVESGLAASVAVYLVLDYAVEAVEYVVFILASWSTYVEGESTMVAFQRSLELIASNPREALGIKVAQSIVCGRSCKWLLRKAIGRHASLLVAAAAHVYFLVLWLVFYISSRSNEGDHPFNHQNLEDFLNRNR